jgi:hypothetical protein
VCAKPYKPTPEELGEFGATAEDVRTASFAKGEGCDECAQTGYKGRLGLFEIMLLNDQLGELILERATSDEIQALSIKCGMTTMRQDGWLKCVNGITTINEVTHHTPRDSKGVAAKHMETMQLQRGLREPDRAPVQTEKPVKAALPWESEAAGPATPQSGEEGVMLDGENGQDEKPENPPA